MVDHSYTKKTHVLSESRTKSCYQNVIQSPEIQKKKIKNKKKKLNDETNFYDSFFLYNTPLSFYLPCYNSNKVQVCNITNLKRSISYDPDNIFITSI